MFEYDSTGQKLKNNQTKSRTIDVKKQQNITSKDVATYNELINKKFTLSDEMPLFKVLNEKIDRDIAD
ncbi:hypothetical protein KA405_02165 [Patescibacteria group bacterium]|nr:hypothetical protein [Patescibacteria group bacterium]